MFPLLLVLVTVTGLVLEDSPRLRDQVLDSALAQFPVIGTDIRSNLGSIWGSVFTLLLGVGPARWAGLGAVRATQAALDSVWDVPIVRRPSAPKAILRSFLLLVSLGVFVLATALLASVTGGAGAPDLAGIAAAIASAALNVGIFAVTYRVLTSAHEGLRGVLPGAHHAGRGWIERAVQGPFEIRSRQASGPINQRGAIGLCGFARRAERVGTVPRNELDPPLPDVTIQPSRHLCVVGCAIKQDRILEHMHHFGHWFPPGLGPAMPVPAFQSPVASCQLPVASRQSSVVSRQSL